MASVSLHDLGLDRLSIEERLQLADAIWDSVVHDEWASDAVLPWGHLDGPLSQEKLQEHRQEAFSLS